MTKALQKNSSEITRLCLSWSSVCLRALSHVANMLMGKERGDSRRFYVSLSKAMENEEKTHVSVVGAHSP